MITDFSSSPQQGKGRLINVRAVFMEMPDLQRPLPPFLPPALSRIFSLLFSPPPSIPPSILLQSLPVPPLRTLILH